MIGNNILILNGPGLSAHNKIVPPKQIQAQCKTLCDQLKLKMSFHLTNNDKELLNSLLAVKEKFSAVIVNPLGCSNLTDNSTLYRSAMNAIFNYKQMVIEVHMHKVLTQDMLITKTAPTVNNKKIAFISGFGINSYLLAIYAINHKKNKL